MTDYTLTADTAVRLLRMLSWWERNPQQGASGTVEIEKEVPNHQFVLTDGDSEVDGSFTYWSGTVQVWDATNETYVECGDCWIKSPSGINLIEAVYYPARQSGLVNPNSVGERALFIVIESCAGCADPGTPPGGWTESDDLCYFDIIQVRCNAGTTEYNRVRVFNVCGRIRTWTGAWGTTNPPAEPS